MGNAQDYVKKITEMNNHVNQAAQHLVYDPDQKRIRGVAHIDPDKPMMDVGSGDLGHAGLEREAEND